MSGVATLGMIASLAFAQAALAAGRDRLPYTGIEGSFGKVTFNHSDAGADRFDIRASLDLGGAVPVFVSAARTQIETEEIDLGSTSFSRKSTLSRLDLGLRLGNDRKADFVPSISVVRTRGEFHGDPALFGNYDETGWAARCAVRALARPWLEFGAFVETMHVAENAASAAAVEAILYPLSHLGVGIGYETSEGQRAVLARLRIVR